MIADNSMSFRTGNHQLARRPVIWIKVPNAQRRQKVVNALSEDFANFEIFTELESSPGATNYPDLIICDNAMNVEAASSRTAQLRQWPELDGVAILLLVSGLDDKLSQQLSELDLIDFVINPFSEAELWVRARHLLAAKQDRMQGRPGATKQLPGAVVDNKHFQLMVDRIDDYAIFMVDLDGRIGSWNQGAEALTGYSVDEAVGRPYSTLYAPKDSPPTRLAEGLARARQAGRYENAGAYKRKDGSTYSAQIMIRRIDDESGVLLGFVTVVHDITARKKAERALKESEAKFRTITDAMPQMVWSTQPDGYHDYYNQQWYEFTGMPEGSTDGAGWNAMFHPDDQARAWRLWAHSLATGEPYEIEYRVRHHSGEYHWTLGRALPVRDDDGNIVRWMGTCTVIQAQKEAEAALQEASRRKDEFLAMLAHELRNPLGPLHNSMVLMRRARSHNNSQMQKALDVAERQVWHMSHLINDLVDVARISRGKMHLHKKNCDLNEIVVHAAEDCRARFDAKGIDLQIDCLDDSLWTDGDPTRIAQVIGNLLHNASKFTPPGGTVRVTTGRRHLPEREQAEVVVDDSGVVIDPALASQLFDPFVQADQDLGRSDGGLGLGLAVVKGLMELHDGSVEAHSEGAGQGTTFSLDFPLASANRTYTTVPTKSLETSKSSDKWRIVLVEDNKDMLETLEALLHAEGHQVVSARDGPTGLEAINQSRPDLVICDIGLPGAMDGYALARAVRASDDPGLSKIFLVALSGYSQDSDRERSRESGFDLHLLKPLNFDELRKLLANTTINARPKPH
ncbi:MAG: PAS domain S-box protein [Cellvibrionaceae bacterium]